MPSFLDGWANSGQVAPDARRHTVDLTANRSMSVTSANSVGSNRSEPSWYSSYNNTDTSKLRSQSNAGRPTLSPRNSSGKLKEKPGTTATSGWKALFSADDSKKESKKEKKERKAKEIDKIVLTSRHSAAVRTKLALDPKLQDATRRSSLTSEPPVGTYLGIQTGSAHITAAEQEFRFPHSGKPSLEKTEKGHFKRRGRSGEEVDFDMPALTRIQSGDSFDEEDEDAQKGREEWVRRRNEAAMRRFTMAEGMEEEDEEDTRMRSVSNPEKMAPGMVMNIQGTQVIGVDLGDAAYTPRAKAKGGLGLGWKRNEEGKWKRPEG